MPLDLAPLNVLRLVVGLARSPAFARLYRYIRREPSVPASIAPSAVYTGFGLITAVPDRLLSARPDFAEISRAEKHEGVVVAPAVLVLLLRLAPHEPPVRVEEIYLQPVERLDVSQASKYVAVIHDLPGAGGKGEPADFSVWHQGGLNVAIPLMEASARAGGDITQPLLVDGVPYGVILSVYPAQPGLYVYRLSARFRRDEQRWTQDLARPFRLLVLGPEDHRQFSGAVALLHDRVDRQLERFPEGGLGLRDSDAAWGGRPRLDANQAYLVKGRSAMRDAMLAHLYAR